MSGKVEQLAEWTWVTWHETSAGENHNSENGKKIHFCPSRVSGKRDWGTTKPEHDWLKTSAGVRLWVCG